MSDERAMRFGYLLSQIEMGAASILRGGVDDIPLALQQMSEQLGEAGAIMREVSREALDKVTGRCPYKAEPEQWVAAMHADAHGQVQCMKEAGHDGPHLMP